MRDVLISDLHLDESRPDLTEGFLRFLAEDLKDADSLYILGDFFEVWLGDDHDTPFNQTIIDALAGLDIPPLYVMHGNRDFLLGDEFCRATGATLLPDPSIVKLGGEDVLLMHGDSLCTRDTAYMQARTLLRDAGFQADFLSKSIAARQAFAAQARGESQAHTGQQADAGADTGDGDIMDVTPSEVVKAMKNAGVSTFIHGHTHRPDVHEVDLGEATGKRIVLGDWGQTGWKIEVDENGIDLIEFPLKA